MRSLVCENMNVIGGAVGGGGGAVRVTGLFLINNTQLRQLLIMGLDKATIHLIQFADNW